LTALGRTDEGLDALRRTNAQDLRPPQLHPQSLRQAARKQHHIAGTNVAEHILAEAVLHQEAPAKRRSGAHGDRRRRAVDRIDGLLVSVIVGSLMAILFL
jgi:hypothetical protein